MSLEYLYTCSKCGFQAIAPADTRPESWQGGHMIFYSDHRNVNFWFCPLCADELLAEPSPKVGILKALLRKWRS